MLQLAEPTRVALASATKQRDVFECAFALDTLLGSTVLGTSEPIVAQIRLTWWRDQIAAGRDGSSSNDPLLDLIFDTWGMDRTCLIALIDGWEALLSDPRDLPEFVAGRSSLATAIALRLNQPDQANIAELNGKLWAYADLASRFEDGQVREWALREANQIPEGRASASRELRPLVVLGGLARRALNRGGTPMLGDRLSPLVALRLGILGT